MARKVAVRSALAIAGLYLVACAAMYFAQRSILFHPDTRDVALDVAKVPRASVVEFATADGATIKAWWVAPVSSDKPVYLYFHGNAETLASRDLRFGLLTADGAGLLGVSWRGYGGSTGTPSEAGFRQDASAAYDWLLAQDLAPERLIVFGESVGTGIAVWLSAQRQIGALVLDSAYTAIYRLAAERYPWLPVQLLLRDPLDSVQWANRIDMPVFMFHCNDDRVVPHAMGVELFAALASTDKRFESIDRACHVPSVQPLMAQFRDLERKLR
jgi:fermentation-respiration switch protein FrsA (DUF1100 family)